MSTITAAIAKAAAALLTDSKARKAIGWIVVAIFSPLILLIAFLCSLGSGGAQSNNVMVRACFYPTALSEDVPAEYRTHVEDMRIALSLLDSAVTGVNSQMESGNSLDPIRVKAVFYALCFGEDLPSARATDDFVGCFYTRSAKENDTALVPLPLESAYANLTAVIGRAVTATDRSNIDHIYAVIAGTAGNGNYD